MNRDIQLIVASLRMKKAWYKIVAKVATAMLAAVMVLSLLIHPKAHGRVEYSTIEHMLIISAYPFFIWCLILLLCRHIIRRTNKNLAALSIHGQE